MLDFLNQQGGLLPEPLAAHLFRQIVDAVCCFSDEPYLHCILAQALPDRGQTSCVSWLPELARSQVLYMHTRGYCHRDLKPENCVIETATMTLKVRAVAACSVSSRGITVRHHMLSLQPRSARYTHQRFFSAVSQVIDFGLSRHLESAATLGIGTPVSPHSPHRPDLPLPLVPGQLA